jgi:hypothetical protein
MKCDSRAQFFRAAGLIGAVFCCFLLTLARVTTAAGPPGPAGFPGGIAISTVPPTPSSTPSVSPTFGDLRFLIEAQDAWDNIKFALPVVVAALLSVLGGVAVALGRYYLRQEFQSLRREIESKIDEKLTESQTRIQNRFQASQDQVDSKFESLRQELQRQFQRSETGIYYQAARARYTLALFAWQMERYYDAVSNGEIALHNIERAIELSASLGNGERMPKDAKTLRCHVLGDLAYYWADSFRRGHLQSEADKAIKYAHLLVGS